MKQYPPIQIVNDKDKPVRGASLQEIHEQGLLHRIVLIIIWDPAGRILLQRRSPNVATNANRWDVSAAGHVDIDEEYEQAAARELDEELGLNDVGLSEIAYYHTYSVLEGLQLNRFIKIYKAKVPADTRFVIDKYEVSEVRWFGWNEFNQLLGRQPEEFNHDFEEILAKISGMT